MSDKTEQPTPARLRKAQEEGDSPLSSFASQSVAFLATVGLAPAAVSALASRAASDLRQAIAAAALPSPEVRFDGAAIATSVVVLVAPVLAAAAVTAGVVSVVQTGGVIATKRLVPTLSKLDPIAGARQLFSLSRLVAVARAALFAGGVAWSVHAVLTSHLEDIANVAGRIELAAALAGTLALEVAKRVAIIGLFLAVIDVVVTRKTWLDRLRMSKDEIKREHKESDGDPQMKAARERAHQEVLASATVGNVRQASVVVVNPTHIACALRYDEEEGDAAPVLVASGHGDLARRIVEAAHHYGVPVLRDVPLARALVELEIGDAIPEALYEAVAEILREAWDEQAREAEEPEG